MTFTGGTSSTGSFRIGAGGWTVCVPLPAAAALIGDETVGVARIMDAEFNAAEASVLPSLGANGATQ